MWAFIPSPTRPFFTTRGAGVWAFSNSPTHQFSRTQRGLVCGRLSLRPHARLLAHTQSWQLPCVSAGYMATALALLVSRWQLSFTRVAMCFCMVHGNCPSVHVSRWQLFLLHGNCPSVLVSTWQLSLLPEHVFLPCLFVVLHGNCLVFSGWQLLKF